MQVQKTRITANNPGISGIKLLMGLDWFRKKNKNSSSMNESSLKDENQLIHFPTKKDSVFDNIDIQGQ